MSKDWHPGGGETIHDCVAPSDDPWQMPLCTECGQIAYQVVIVKKADASLRQVPLCARHFVSACLQLPELNKYYRGGKLG
ncbi:MAG TPA: hypothetical protein VGP89_15870 [Candidatus Angelobacter sp.]|jgi:hypothetical protein|nr:hypothetical protein [Candidatus Angelobacter sp.]